MKKTAMTLAAPMLLALTAIVPTAQASQQIDLQGVTFNVDTIQHYNVGRGLTHTHLFFRAVGESRQFHAYVLDLDRQAAENMRLKVDVGHDSVANAERISSIATRKSNDKQQYLAAVNGDFFVTSSYAAVLEFGAYLLGSPNMSCATDHRLVTPDIIDKSSHENAFLVADDGLWIDATDLKYQILSEDNATVIDATAANYQHHDNEMTFFNSFYGRSTKAPAGSRELSLRLADGESWAMNRPVKMVVSGDWSTNGAMAIPDDGIVISCGASYANSFIDSLRDGDTVMMNIELSLPAFEAITPDISEVLGGDVRILNNNVTTTSAIRWINTPSSKYSRSLVGYSQDRGHVVACVVDCTSGSTSSGVTYYEAADLMRGLGCWDALDLDGGGSTTMWMRHSGTVNYLRDGSERAVANGLFFVLDAPADNEVAEIRFLNQSITLPRNGLYTPVIYGYNRYGALVDTDVQGFTLSAPSELGSITDDGSALLASGSGTWALTASLGDITATSAVTVSTDSSIEPRLSNVLIDNIRQWTIELQSLVGDDYMAVSPLAYQWSVEDPEIAQVDANGVVRGLKDGVTKLIGTDANSSIQIDLTVECPQAARQNVLTGDFNSDDWKFSRTSVSSASVSAMDDGGMGVDFTISSTRGPALTMSHNTLMWSLPDAIEITINPGTAPVKDFSLSLLSADQTRSVKVTRDNLTADTDNVLTFDVSEFADPTDIAIYPLTFVSMSLGLSSPTGTYHVSIPSIKAVYNNFTDGVTDPCLTNESTTVSYRRLGDTLLTSSPVQRADVYDLTGRLLMSATNTSAITLPAPSGVYLIKLTLPTATQTLKLSK